MSDSAHIRSVFARYPELLTAGKVDEIVNLYREDASIEDPVGEALHEGRDAIRAFYEASAGKVHMKLTGPVRVAGREAAAPLCVLMGPEGQQQVIDIIDIMTFDEEGRIATMRAIWSMDAMRPATADD